jgi:hypothetical protein
VRSEYRNYFSVNGDVDVVGKGVYDGNLKTKSNLNVDGNANVTGTVNCANLVYTVPTLIFHLAKHSLSERSLLGIRVRQQI